MNTFKGIQDCNLKKVIYDAPFNIDFTVAEGNDFAPAPIIGDKMVLQRRSVNRLFGRAKFSGYFAVRINNTVNYGYAENGSFELFLQPMLENASNQDLTLFCQNSKYTIRDVLIGEVFLMSGQSNMAWTLAQSLRDQGLHGGSEYPYTGGRYIPKKGELFYEEWLRDSPERNAMIEGYTMPAILSENKLLRVFKIDTEDSQIDPQEEFIKADTPREFDDPKIKYIVWSESEESSNGYMSAISFYFGSEMFKLLNVPIAVVIVALCGSVVSTWTPKWDYEANKSQFHYGGEHALKEPDNAQNLESRCFNMFLAPIRKYRFGGVVWYQGETQDINWANSMKVMISAWRRELDCPNIPFLTFQVARVGMFDTLQSCSDDMGDEMSTLSLIYFNCREQQRKLSKIVDNCTYVVNVDGGDYDEIHYFAKRDIGVRGARKFAKHFYGMQNIADAPEVLNAVINSDQSVYIYFSNVQGRLQLLNNGRNFEISHDGVNFIRAKVCIKDINCIRIENCGYLPIKVIRYGALNYPKISRHDMTKYLSLFDSSGYPANQFIIKF